MPFYGRFIPDASSNNVAPKLKISALVLIFSEIVILFFNNSGAIYTESPSTSSSLNLVRLFNSIAYPKSPNLIDPSVITK
jgi:hypothetical protein